MKILCSYLTHIGNIRENNEDSLLVFDKIIPNKNLPWQDTIVHDQEKLLYAVADGMGGHAKGEVASQTVLEVTKNSLKEIEDYKNVEQIIFNAKICLDDIANTDSDSIGLGTTISALLLQGKKGIIFHIGDSRIYKFMDGTLTRLTKDHSLVQNLFENGLIEEDEMRTHPIKNILTSALIGDYREKMPDIFYEEIPITKGDQFLLCTDGVWESLSLAEMQECMLMENQDEKLKTIMERVLYYGAKDNLTMVLLEVLET